MKKTLALILALLLILAVSASAEKTTIRYADTIPDSGRQAVHQEIIDDYNAAHDDVEVVLENIPWDQAHQKLVVMASSNSLPDVVLVHPSWYAEFASAEWLLPLDDYYANWDQHDDILPFVDSVMIGDDQVMPYGHVLGIPNAIATHGMFVRTDWLEEAGIDKDSLVTWHDIYDAAAKLTDKSKNRYGFGFRGGRGGFDHMMFAVACANEGILYDENGVCTFNNEASKQAVKEFCDLFFNEYTPRDAVNWGFTEMVQGFTSGLVGILNQNADVIANCKEVMEDGTWDTIVFPKSDFDGKLYSKADSFIYSIAATCPTPDLAWDFIDFLIQPENNTKTCMLGYNSPVTVTASQNEFFSEGPTAAYAKALMDPDFVRRPLYGYFPETAEFTEVYADSQLQSYLLGQITLDEFCDNIANYLTEYQQKYMQEHPEIPIPGPSVIN